MYNYKKGTIGKGVDMEGIIIFGLIVAVMVLASMNSTKATDLKECAIRIKFYKEELEQHQDYLKKVCGYSIPTVSCLPMAEEIETMEYHGEFLQYEKKYKKLGLLATADIGSTLYDIRECRYNKAVIKAYNLGRKTNRSKK